MTAVPLSTVVDHLRSLATPHQSDSQLLERFVSSGDAAAFAGLVRRHGPLVLGVCRRLLRDPHEAEDAFQATFLVLARKARSIRVEDSLSPWLYGVTYRIALRARSHAARRARRASGVVAEHVAAPSVGDPDLFDLRPVLHEELGRLPETYRAPLVLCYLEGLSTEAAADRLGCPRGTVLSRLSRARERLRERLTRRGVALPSSLAAGALAAEGASASVPAALLSQTVRAGLAFAGRHEIVSASAIPAAASTLATGVLKTMTTTKLAMVAAAGGCVAGAAGGVGAGAAAGSGVGNGTGGGATGGGGSGCVCGVVGVGAGVGAGGAGAVGGSTVNPGIGELPGGTCGVPGGTAAAPAGGAAGGGSPPGGLMSGGGPLPSDRLLCGPM